MEDCKILLGDCLELLYTLPSASVDLILTDLPYGTTNCKWDSPIPLDKLWAAYKHVSKKSTPIVLFSTQPFTTTLIASNIPEFKYCWYWIKEKGTGFLNSKKQPMRAVEELCVFRAKGYNPQMIPLDKPRRRSLPIRKSDIYNEVQSVEGTVVEQIIYTHSFPKNVIEVPRDKGNNGLIPTQKPVLLLEYLVRTYSKKDEIVLDSCMGSGTTGVACKNLDRKFIGIELDAKHYSIAEKRLERTKAPLK